MRAKIQVGDLITFAARRSTDPTHNRSDEYGIYLGTKARLPDPGEHRRSGRASNWHMILVDGKIKLLHKKYLTDDRINVLSSLGVNF